MRWESLTRVPLRAIGFSPRFELGWYIRSEKELAQLKKIDPRLWKHIQHSIDSKEIRRESILIISKKDSVR